MRQLKDREKREVKDNFKIAAPLTMGVVTWMGMATVVGVGDPARVYIRRACSEGRK